MNGMAFVKYFFLFYLVIIFCSCHPKSEQRFKSETTKICTKIGKELASINTVADLNKKKKILKDDFEKLVDILIEAKEFEKKYGWTSTPIDEEQTQANEYLLKQLNRVLSIEGSQKILEIIQRPSLERMDAYYQKEFPQ